MAYGRKAPRPMQPIKLAALGELRMAVVAAIVILIETTGSRKGIITGSDAIYLSYTGRPHGLMAVLVRRGMSPVNT